MTLLKAKSMYIAEGKTNEKQMYTGEYFDLNGMCGFIWARVSLARGERVYIAMQRKILVVEKCVCYQEKEALKGKVFR